MGQMFTVRSARALPPPSLSRAIPVHAVCVAATPRRHASRAAPLPASHTRLSTRQEASAFNQPLNFDTAKLTRMDNMFSVRSARALAATALSRALPVHAACVASTPRPHASWAAPLPASHARLSTRQEASAFNQPLNFDTSKVTTMHAMFRVRSARALAPSSLESDPPRACRLRRRHPTPSRLLGRTSSRIACPPFDSAGRKLLVRRQQAAHPLRVGGHLGLRLRWLWLELGTRKLRVRSDQLECCSNDFENRNNIM